MTARGRSGDHRLAAWRLFIENGARLQTVLDERLRASDRMTLSDYHVLLLLSEAPERRLRMRDLSQQMVFSASRLSYQIQVLERRGWVRREPVPDDRRGAFACLTDDGSDAFTAAARRHGADVDAWFQAALTDDDARALHAVMARLASHLDTMETS